MSESAFHLENRVHADLLMNKLFLQASMGRNHLPAELTAPEAFELGHWLLSAAEEMRLLEGQ